METIEFNEVIKQNIEVVGGLLPRVSFDNDGFLTKENYGGNVFVKIQQGKAISICDKNTKYFSIDIYFLNYNYKYTFFGTGLSLRNIEGQSFTGDSRLKFYNDGNKLYIQSGPSAALGINLQYSDVDKGAGHKVQVYNSADVENLPSFTPE